MNSTEKRPEIGSVFIFGCGAVGTALAIRMMSVGIDVVGAHCRSEASARRGERRTGLEVTFGQGVPEAVERAAVILVAVPDPVIPVVARQLAESGLTSRDQVVFHCSGARNADALSPLRALIRGVGSFHPLLSFADPSIASRLLPRATFAVEGDSAAVERARELVGGLGGQLLLVEASDRVLYHAAAATASNHLVALAAQAVACLEALGVEHQEATKALIPLMQSTLDNLGRLGLPHALTGPVSRGDAACVEGHLNEISGRSPGELIPYVVMAARAIDVARDLGVASDEALLEVERLLSRRFEVITMDFPAKALDRGLLLK